MTAFEEKGCTLQMESTSTHEARQRFERSCNLCCSKGRNVSCDRCPINACHEQVVKTMAVLSASRQKVSSFSSPRYSIMVG